MRATLTEQLTANYSHIRTNMRIVLVSLLSIASCKLLVMGYGLWVVDCGFLVVPQPV